MATHIVLASEALGLERDEVLVRHIVDAVDWTRVDRLLDEIVRVAHLVVDACLAGKRVLHEERVARHVSAILAPDACCLVDVSEACLDGRTVLVEVER
jgi:hypothetical protein